MEKEKCIKNCYLEKCTSVIKLSKQFRRNNRMQAFEVMGTVDERGELSLDNPLDIDTPCRVKVILLVADEPDFNPDDPPVAAIKGSLRRAF